MWAAPPPLPPRRRTYDLGSPIPGGGVGAGTSAFRKRDVSMGQATGIILSGGMIVDGTGAPGFSGQVAICDGKIAAVTRTDAPNPGALDRLEHTLIDCAGCVVAPGFIDIHSHSDLKVIENRTEKVLQGVTAEVVGNCGFSPYPVPDNPQILRDFANGILCGDNNWGLAFGRGLPRQCGSIESSHGCIFSWPRLVAN